MFSSVLVDGGAGGSAAGRVIGGTTHIRLDAAGDAVRPLTPNDQIEPSGTHYRCTLLGTQPTLVRLIAITADTPDATSWADPAIQQYTPSAPVLAAPPRRHHRRNRCPHRR